MVFALLLALGTWQWQRRTWKEGLLAAIAERQALQPATSFDPAALGCAPTKGLDDPCDFRPVLLTGRMSAAPEVHIFISIPRQPNGLQGNGYWVLRVFTAAASGSRIWVNTGFVPADKKAALPAPSADDSAIRGVLRRAEPRGRFSGANDLAKNVYYVRDPKEFPPCAAAGAPCEADYYVDMTGPTPAGGLPYPMAGQLAIPNRHLEYALTWYGLAATWLVIAGLALRKRAVNDD